MDIALCHNKTQLKRIGLLIALMGIFCGCIKVKFVEQDISPESTCFENSYFSISYPKEWVITFDTPSNYYDSQEDFKRIAPGEHEVFAFCDPQHPLYSVWLIFDKQEQAETQKRIPQIVQHYKYILNQEGYANLSADIHPVYFRNMTGMKIVVRGEGFKDIQSGDPILPRLRKIKKIAQEIPANNAERHEKAYHIFLLRLENTVVTLNYTISSVHSQQVAERLEAIVKSIKIKNGFPAPKG